MSAPGPDSPMHSTKRGSCTSQIHYPKAVIQHQQYGSNHNPRLQSRPCGIQGARWSALLRTAFFIFLAAAARAWVVATDFGSRLDGFAEQGRQVARLTHVLRQFLHVLVLLPWEVQIKSEAHRLIAWPHTDPVPGLSMLSVFTRMAVPLQCRSGNANRVVVAVNREACSTTAQTHGEIMTLSISDTLSGKIFDAVADLPHSVFAER